MTKVSLLFVSILFFFSCSDSCDDGVDISKNSKKVDLKRSDLTIRNIASFNELKDFLKKDTELTQIIIPDNSLFEETSYKIYQLANDTLVEPLYKEVDKKFDNNDQLNKKLSDLFARTGHYFPSFKQPQVKGFVSAFGGYDLIQSKNTILIGLDYFLGPQPKFYDTNFPGYILKYYTKEQLPYKISMLLSKQWNNFDPKDKTVLAHMIYYGKAYYYTSKMVPCTNEANIVEYSSEEIDLLLTDPSYVWQHFVSNKLFYSNDHEHIRKYIDDRPNTFEVGENCPGRVGRWLGYEIVKSYMENNEVSLAELMAEKDSKKIFNESHYHPKSK